MAQRNANQHGLIDPHKLAETKFTVIGAGSIGSFFTMALTKMGATNITVFDADTIEEHNIDNQMYPMSAVGSKKVDALSGVTISYGEAIIYAQDRLWTAQDATLESDVVVVAVDNMDTRKAIWDAYKERRQGLFLEARMGAMVYFVYGVDLADNAQKVAYENTLYPHSEAVPERCGQKSIIFTVLQVSGQMLAQVFRFINRQTRPFSVNYDCFNDNVIKTFVGTWVGPKAEELEVEVSDGANYEIAR